MIRPYFCVPTKIPSSLLKDDYLMVLQSAMPTNFVVYQAYGQLAILTEVLFSTASVLARATIPPQLIIYTDQADWFRQYPWLEGIKYRTLDDDQLNEWAGQDQFVHRVKICILQDALQHCDGKILYLDSDTLLLSDTDELFAQIEPSSFLMHSNEGTLRSSTLKLNRKLGSYLAGKQWNIKGQGVEISKDMTMFNAGVIGFMTEDAQYFLPQVLALTDKLYHAWQKHTMEQLAFSYILGHGQVIDTTKDVLHYWKLKPLRPVLIELAQSHLDLPDHQSATDLLDQLNTRFDFVNMLKVQQNWDALPSIWRKIMTLLGRGWDLRQQ